MVVVIGNLYVLPLVVLVCLMIGTMIDLKIVILLIFKSCRTNKLDVSSYSNSLDSLKESNMKADDGGVSHLT